ncbi:MAG: hypothetical protein V3U72_04565 [Candidatus Aenigmarchaeota archaeon]
MNCPKCDGGSYILEEEAIKVLENTKPMRIIMRVTYVCRSCSEKFSRIFWEDVELKKRPQEFQTQPSPGMPTSEYAVRPGMSTTGETKEPGDRLRFLDNI